VRGDGNAEVAETRDIKPNATASDRIPASAMRSSGEPSPGDGWVQRRTTPPPFPAYDDGSFGVGDWTSHGRVPGAAGDYCPRP
jgi:hypothetical protein